MLCDVSYFWTVSDNEAEAVKLCKSLVNKIFAQNCARASQGSYPYTYAVSFSTVPLNIVLTLSLLQEIMEVAKTVALQNGKADHGLTCGSVWTNTKATPYPGTKVKTEIKDKTPKKEKKKGANKHCINWNNTGACKASSQGKECQFDHSCSVITSTGSNPHCNKSHPAKDHTF